MAAIPKRIIACCDGTWMDSLGKKGGEPPSNVTRIARSLRRGCRDGTHQIISYYAGVGTNGNIDQITGGTFGLGLDREIRDVYAFICSNYVDGDDIVLIGFSRGAFTARSVANMIASIGLLTHVGMEHFYAIFEDYENIGDKKRDGSKFLVQNLVAFTGEDGDAQLQWEAERLHAYRKGLKAMDYTRDTHLDGTTQIKVKAVAVWDTVGALGIPPAPVLGIKGSAEQWRFTRTVISKRVENAFQALAIDEPRYAFRPALWERTTEGVATTKLKQVWFPGEHATVGGGWHDQHMANITLAWMCDQLSQLGIEFNFRSLTEIFTESLHYAAAHPYPAVPGTLSDHFHPNTVHPWASSPVYHTPNLALTASPADEPARDKHDCTGTDVHPSGTPAELLAGGARAWALGQTRYPTSTLQKLAGTTVRRPGRTMRVDQDTNADLDIPLYNTGERVHSSVRVRLACGGLGLDDHGVWQCEALLGSDKDKTAAKNGEGRPLWRLERVPDEEDPGTESLRRGFKALELENKGGERWANDYPAERMYAHRHGDGIAGDEPQWRWVLDPAEAADPEKVSCTVLLEEPMVGYWERYLLALMAGDPDVWKWAEENPPAAATGAA